MARPSKLTKEVKDKLVYAIKLGLTRESAASYAGIHVATFYEWLAIAEDHEDERYAELADALKSAEAEGQIKNLEIIQKAAEDKQWQAAAWVLERRHPKEWARVDRLAFTDSEGKDIVSDEERVTRITTILDRARERRVGSTNGTGNGKVAAK